jgi:hypothetical protein
MQDNTGDHIRQGETNCNVSTSEEHTENKTEEKMQSSIQLERN